MISVDDLNALNDKVLFYEKYMLEVLPATRDLHDYELLWNTIARFYIRISSGGDIYSLIAACFGREMSDKTSRLQETIKNAMNFVIPAKTRYDKELMGVEQIFTTLWGSDIRHGNPQFHKVYDGTFMPVETAIIDFVAGIKRGAALKLEQLKKRSA